MQYIDYKQKYLKYKAKYLELKGGATPPWAEELKNKLNKYNDDNGMTYEELKSNIEIFKDNNKKLYYYDVSEDQKTFEITKVSKSFSNNSTLTITYNKNNTTNIVKTKEFKGTVIETKDFKGKVLETKIIYPILIILNVFKQQQKKDWKFLLKEIK